ncbi:MAG TPA: zinc ribbon domain-containing protein [Ktedonobacteraceae bacterium]|nr:zinc ribbon domain-containing protein [Ktedonobacteraceae bacterium]
MRCPYCGKMNVDSAAYCTSCGRDLQSGRPVQTPTQGARQTSYPPSRQAPPPPAQQPYQPNVVRPAPPPVPPGQTLPQSQPQPQQVGTQRAARTRSTATGAATYPSPAPLQPPVPSAPESPAPFPPRTMEQLRALEEGALAYTVVDSSVSVGRKKVVRISYGRAVAWQQAATLLKALKEQIEDRFDTIIIQGVLPQDINVYAFTNGQLTCDRNVLLGSQKLTRYILETDNGFDSDSVRVVLTEPQSGK